MEEKRKFERHRLLKNGQIRFANASGSVRCVVRDISTGGAQLLVNSVSGIPSEFKLQLEGQQARNCFVRWRDGFRLGVVFLSPGSASIEM
jgi:hypothetical protein